MLGMKIRSAWLIAAFLLCATCGPTIAQGSTPTADQVKAAYLHKFAGYVDWPPAVFAGPAAPFVVGVYGADGVFAELSRLAAGRPVQGRSVEVRNVARFDVLAEVHIVYVGRGAATSLGPLLDAYRARPVVTVTETAGLQAGAVLNFLDIERRIRFEASPATAEQRGLKLSSRLLAVAERVEGVAP